MWSVHMHKLSVYFWLMFVLSSPDIVCSCVEAMSGRIGELKTPNYPGNYDNNLNCTWTITVDTYDTITVAFKGFYLEEANENVCADHFYVYDGPSSSSAVILHACGSEHPKPIISSGNSLTFTLITDEKENRTGVSLIWRVSDKFTLNTNPVTWSAANAACLKEGGHLAMKNYLSELFLTKLLSNYSEGVWFGDYLTPWIWLKGCYKDKDRSFIPGKNYSESKHKVLQACQFQCEDSVYFGLQGRKCLCLTSEEMGYLVLSQPATECRMSCQEHRTGMCGGAFALTVFMNDVCWKNSTTWTGRISRTKSGRECQPWQSDSPHTHSFHGNDKFPDISEEAASNYCRDPSGEGAPWCFTTDDEVPRQFCDVPPCAENANPKENTGNGDLCRVFRTNDSGVFYEEQSCSQTESFACFTDKQGVKLILYTMTPIDFHTAAWTECQTQYGLADYRLFSELRNNTNVKNKPYWLGSFRTEDFTKDKDSTPTPSTCKTIRYQENELQRETQASCEFHFGFVCQTEAVLCGETLFADDGYISWPGNQTQYNNDKNCQWEITVSDGRSITVTFLNVDLEASNSCSFDFIEVSETSVNEYKRLDKLCGNASNITVSSLSNAVRIRFKSDLDTSGSGFQLKWWSELKPTTTVTTPIQSSEPGLTSTLHNSQRVTNLDDGTNYSLGGGAIAGIVAGGVFVIIVIVIALAVLIRRQRKSVNYRQEPTELQRSIHTYDNTALSDTNPDAVYSKPVAKESRKSKGHSLGEQPSGDLYYDHLNQGLKTNANQHGTSNTYDKLPTGDIYDHTTQEATSVMGEEYEHLDNKKKGPRLTGISEYNSFESTIKQPVKGSDDYDYFVQETAKVDN